MQYDSKHSYGNTLVELENGEISLLGIHVKPNEQMWDMLLKPLKGSRKYTFLAGDFNAYEYRGEMKDKPRQIREAGYKPFIQSSVITDIKHNSSIDNIYVRTDYGICGDVTTTIRKAEMFQTDHVLCGIEFEEKKV